ncbi:hypothetical protein [Hymenobacter sp. BT559]|uniref:hypothetical protein n=1 Tax=Hymenobacter sp. BT559 TaxID=2795729 RepID=UPI0018EA9AA7|nr:hypothetical protein [Hymenobacter sp. BT559]MBJ6145717.1 hypothetical protein [Hymenobacter sp. BT559]
MSVAITTAQATQVLTSQHIDTITNLVLGGDLSKMDNAARVAYYVQLCQSLSLNPHTQPFQILKFQGKEIMYATKSCTEQLRKLWGVSVTKLDRHQEGDVLVVVAYVVDGTGRTDAGTGAVPVTNLKGEALANAFMKAETKAKRRATLSICGLGILDESELDTMPQATQVAMPATAEVGTSATVVEEPTPVAATLDEAKVAGHRTRMMYARSLVEVQQIWKEIPKHLAPQLLADKDAAKLRLSKQPAPQPVHDQELVKEFVEHPTTGMNLPEASEEQRAEITRLMKLPIITAGERADMLKVFYKLDEARAEQAIFKLLNEQAVREGRDADKEWRQALHKFIYKNSAQLGDYEVSRLSAMNEDGNVHWQTLRAEILNAIATLKQAQALAA